jgi:hypothetical protein
MNVMMRTVMNVLAMEIPIHYQAQRTRTVRKMKNSASNKKNYRDSKKQDMN